MKEEPSCVATDRRYEDVASEDMNHRNKEKLALIQTFYCSFKRTVAFK